jgi:hypothetical protein
MATADDRIKAMEFDYPEHIPVSVNFLPATWIKYRESLDEVVERHPIIFGTHPEGDRDYDTVGGTYVMGEHMDAWGCGWHNVAHGMEGIVKHHPVPTREAIHTLQPPKVDGHLPHGFMFLRLTDLRGFEKMMIDFAEEPLELQMMIDIVLEHNMKNLEISLQNHSFQIITFGDDLGMQTSLPISPQKWRKYLKPCYAKIYGRCHQSGYSVYMHSDGHITEIIPDLIECGVNIINPQIRANGFESLVEVCKGAVCVDLDLDRQMFPFCQPEDIDLHIGEVVRKLGSPEGGLWLKAECGPDVPLQNIEAICVALETYRSYF